MISVIPNEILDLAQIQALDMSYQVVNILPEALKNLKRLTV
jgi:hypothetical protein